MLLCAYWFMIDSIYKFQFKLQNVHSGLAKLMYILLLDNEQVQTGSLMLNAWLCARCQTQIDDADAHSGVPVSPAFDRIPNPPPDHPLFLVTKLLFFVITKLLFLVTQLFI